MAFQSPLLFSTVLANAAGDLGKRYYVGTASRQKLQHAFTYHRDRALGILAKHMNQNALLTADQESENSVLAAITILCYHEMKWPQSGLWLLHLRAARSVITNWMIRTLTNCPPNATRTFLIQEIFSIDVVTDITSFTPIPFESEGFEPVPEDDSNAIFMGFLRIIRHITQTERQQLTHSHLGRPIDLPTLRIELAKAYSHAFTCRQSHALRSPQARRDFEHVIGVFYYSVLLYGYQTLLEPLSAKTVASEACERLFEHLNSIKYIESFAQEMAWPVFVAGTECCGKPEKQAIVEQRMGEIVRINGPLDRGNMMDFLRWWWGRDEEKRRGETWIKLAKERASEEGKSFLVF